MKKIFKKLYVGSLVYDLKKCTWFQIRDHETLNYVSDNWETLFTGVDLNQKTISLFFPEFELSIHTESSIRYSLYKNEDRTVSLASFYGIYEMKDPLILNRGNSSNYQYAEIKGYFWDPFKDFYCIRESKKIHFKFVHELLNFIDLVLLKEEKSSENIRGQF